MFSDEAQTRLVHERCNLQRMVAALDAQIGRGTTSEMLIADRYEAVRRSRLASCPRAQQDRDFYIRQPSADCIVRQEGDDSTDFSRP